MEEVAEVCVQDQQLVCKHERSPREQKIVLQDMYDAASNILSHQFKRQFNDVPIKAKYCKTSRTCMFGPKMKRKR